MCHVIFKVWCIHCIPANFGEKHMLLASLFISELKTYKAIDRQELLFVPCAGWQLGNWVRLGLLSTDTHPLCISSTEQAICAKQVLGFQWNEASVKAYLVKLFCRWVKASVCKETRLRLYALSAFRKARLLTCVLVVDPSSTVNLLSCGDRGCCHWVGVKQQSASTSLSFCSL